MLVRLRWNILILLLAGLIPAAGTGPTAFGHGGHSHANERTWNFANGRSHIHGSFVAAKDGLVQIRRSDDTLVQFKLAEFSAKDQEWVEERIELIRKTNEELKSRIEEEQRELRSLDALVPTTWYQIAGLATVNNLPMILMTHAIALEESPTTSMETPEMAAAFDAFVKNKSVTTRWDKDYFYIESNGMPDHPMMVGITAWQQQVPLPQAYVGNNAWQIPLHPVSAKNPVSANGNFLRGAIALAVNGIPIFNPLNNRGDDAYLFGELDEFGGHCGRADDYHYHIAPTHLEKINGKSLPLAYALDGYPIYGYDEPDGSPVKNLDKLNGHKGADGKYHYHATKTYPYLNGGFYGVVTERGGQVEPQPRAEPMRPSLTPLRGAKITNFQETKPGSYQLTYDVSGKMGTVSYTINKNGSVDFVFVGTNGKSTTESYQPKQRGPGPDRPPRGGDRQPPPPAPPRRNDPAPPRNGEPQNKNANAAVNQGTIQVTSSAFPAGGMMPAEFTCDGAKISPPVEWANLPEGTKFVAVSLWHVAPDQEKSYWVVYNIPADTKGLPKNNKDVGTMGLNDKRRTEYDPMCSKGPGEKEYHITVYALSDKINQPPGQMNRARLKESIKKTVLAEGTMTYKYERKK